MWYAPLAIWSQRSSCKKGVGSLLLHCWSWAWTQVINQACCGKHLTGPNFCLFLFEKEFQLAQAGPEFLILGLQPGSFGRAGSVLLDLLTSRLSTGILMRHFCSCRGLGLVPSTHSVAHIHLSTPVPEDPMLPPGFWPFSCLFKWRSYIFY